MAFGCTLVSTVTRLRSWLRNPPASYATRRISASSNSSLSPSRLRQWLRSERSCGNAEPAILAVERGDFAVDPVPIDLAGQQNQLVLQIDDLVQPRFFPEMRIELDVVAKVDAR